MGLHLDKVPRIETEKLVFSSGWKWGEKYPLLFNGFTVPVGMIKKTREIDKGEDSTTM